MAKRTIVIFDLVETLLDLSALDKLFRAEMGSSRLRHEWFQEALRMAFAITASNRYQPFADITEAALKVIENKHETHLSWLGRRRILSAVRHVPVFEDVIPGLRLLSESGARVAVLTNSAKSLAISALKNSDALKYFDEVFSSESVKRLKPAAEPYRYAAKKLHAKPKQIMFVAAHSWDVAGAKTVGFRTCFVQRPGQVLDELTPKPDLIVSNIIELTESL